MIAGNSPRRWLMIASLMLPLLFAWGCTQSEDTASGVSEVPSKPLSVFILSPLNEDVYLQGELIRFEADPGENGLNDN